MDRHWRSENIRGVRINADVDGLPRGGAAFNVPLRGLDEHPFMIHQLRVSGQPSDLTQDELDKEYLINWTDAMLGIKDLVKQIEHHKFRPVAVVGVGRSGGILGGIVAGNLTTVPKSKGHVPVFTLERRHPETTGPKRQIFTLTERPETYAGSVLLKGGAARHVWSKGPILLIMGEAKTGSSLPAATTWLKRRGITKVRTAALLKGHNEKVNYWWLEAESAILPWQFKAGYDRNWPTFR